MCVVVVRFASLFCVGSLAVAAAAAATGQLPARRKHAAAWQLLFAPANTQLPLQLSRLARV